MKRTPFRHKPRKDPVTPEMARLVFERDRLRCAAPSIDAMAGECRNRFGDLVLSDDRDSLTIDHVQDGYGRMGLRATSDLAHCVVICWGHHLNGWATSHRPELRAYIQRANGSAA
jgi:hypothetical protein